MADQVESTEEPQPTLAEQAAQWTSNDVKAAYDRLDVEFQHVSNQPKSGARTDKLRVLSADMAVLASAYQAAEEEITKPGLEAEEPEVTEPEEVEPEATEPEVPEVPEATKPEATEPEVTEEAPEPKLEETQPEGEPVSVSASSTPTNTGVQHTVDRQLQPFRMETESGPITNMQDFAAALQLAAAAKRDTTVGTISPFGNVSHSEQALGRDPEANYYRIYGDTPEERMANFSRSKGSQPGAAQFTAAINCKGPAQPVLDIPFCFTDGRPLEDSGIISAFPAVHGQIQLYDCRSLPEFPEGILEESADCEDCATCPDLVCAKHECIEPLPPMEPDRFISCMCIPESLQWANPIVLEQTLREWAVANDRAYELRWLDEIYNLALVRDVTAAPPHGADATIRRAMYALKSRLAINPRENCGGLENYRAFIPGGESLFCATMADRHSRMFNCDTPGEDILQMVNQMTGGNIVFGLDQDPNGVQAGLFPDAFDDMAMGTPAPLEDIVNAGEIYLIPNGTLATASPMQTSIDLNFTDRCSHASGCLKLQRAEWWFPMFTVGCRKPIVLRFTDLDTCGTGPDLTPC